MELINGILLTSRYNELTRPYVGYGLMTEEENDSPLPSKPFFKPYREHKIYKVLEAMIPNGFTFSRPVELALAFDESGDFSFRFPLSSLCIAYSGGLGADSGICRPASRLAKESGYFDFFSNAGRFLFAPISKRARETVGARPFAARCWKPNSGRGSTPTSYVVSVLMKGNFGLHFPASRRLRIRSFSVFSTDSLSLSPAILLHEYAHPFINPLTEKYRSLVYTHQNAYEWLSKCKLPDYRSGYDGWEECVNEHLVRAMTIHLLRRCGYTDTAEQMLRNDLYCGYKYIPLLLERYCAYDGMRRTYPNFESYYPELLSVFSGAAGTGFRAFRKFVNLQ